MKKYVFSILYEIKEFFRLLKVALYAKNPCEQCMVKACCNISCNAWKEYHTNYNSIMPLRLQKIYGYTIIISFIILLISIITGHLRL